MYTDVVVMKPTSKQVSGWVSSHVILVLGLLAFKVRLELVEVVGKLGSAETANLVRRLEGLDQDTVTLHYVLKPARVPSP